MLRIGWIVLGTVGVCWLAVVLLLWAAQGRLIFPVPAGATEPRLPGARLLRLGGVAPAVALHLPAEAGRDTVVFFHGNGEQLSDTVEWAYSLASQGLGFFGVEYPGYGLAAGPSPSERAIYAAAETALAHLREQLGVPPERTVLCGLSLGTGVATEMAARGRGGRLVLVAPFTSVREMAARLAPFAPVGLLLRHAFDNAAKAPSLDLPVLVVHGTADAVIPVEMGRRLAGLFPRAELRVVAGADHYILGSQSDQLASCVAAFADGRPCQLLSAE